jgi:hypothetical protein
LYRCANVFLVAFQDNWYKHLTYGNESDLNPFFYGVTLVHKPKSYTYQSDAISANMQLNESHYNSQHLYRVEWEPPDVNGTGGYVKWFTDDNFVFGIYGDSLEIMQTEIPSEPMYLLMNTAVSSHWGFPQPCPANCECDCFECGNPQCQCALPPGYCENFPASFEIDYVRVYQAENDPKHILGCSPKERPTELFIEGHMKRYMTESQTRPLLSIQNGGGSCEYNRDCGGSRRGSCSSRGSCSCLTNWTGPHCSSHDAFYDFDSGVKREPFVRKCVKSPRAVMPRVSSPVRFALVVSSMMVPNSLLVTICFLIAGFIYSLASTLRKRVGETKHGKIDGGEMISFVSTHASQSYQQRAADSYALPKLQQKDVTYCVIDGRLVDS